MKKSILFALISIALFTTSCLTVGIAYAKLAADEEADIQKGNIFEIEEGEITYNNGVFFAFKDHGRYQYIKSNSEMTLLTPTDSISFTQFNKTYTKTSWDREGAYDSRFVFRYRQYELYEHMESFGDENHDWYQKKYIAGKSCHYFHTNTGEEAAGYERILFLYNNTHGTHFEATKFSATTKKEYFEIPSDYKQK